jgi:hypothetical protein
MLILVVSRGQLSALHFLGPAMSARYGRAKGQMRGFRVVAARDTLDITETPIPPPPQGWASFCPSKSLKYVAGEVSISRHELTGADDLVNTCIFHDCSTFTDRPHSARSSFWR